MHELHGTLNASATLGTNILQNTEISRLHKVMHNIRLHISVTRLAVATFTKLVLQV